MKILVIEDDQLTAQALMTILTAHNYAVEVAGNGPDGLVLLSSFEYDLLILDVELPNIDGIKICRQVRDSSQSLESTSGSQGSQIPILLLTGRSSHHDRALGLDAGADDYMVKPFNEEELVARIRALLRRATATASPSLDWGDLHLDPSTFNVRYGDAPLALTPKEYALLELFLRNSRRVFSCGNILEHLWTYEDTPGEEAVRTHIKGLRQKLKTAGAVSDFIETIYGIGYRLKPVSSPTSSPNTGNTTTTQTLRSKLNGIWNRHKDHISAQIAVIEQVIEPVIEQVIEPVIEPEQQRQLAIQQSHALAGTLGTFGFAEGSRLAREIETILIGEQKKTLKPKALKQLQDLTTTLRRVIDVPKSSRSTITLDPGLTTDDSDLLVVVSEDPVFLHALQTEGSHWNYQIMITAIPTTVAKLYDRHASSIVLVDLECFDSWESGMTFLATLTHQSPNSITIVITNQNTLAERLDVSRNGGRLLLQKSNSIAQILTAITQVQKRVTPTQSKILIVDDDIALLAALVALLKPWGFHLFTLSEVHRFWETLEAIEPDVLVLDIELPNLSGIELCQVVRSDLNWSHMPVVMMTAHSDLDIVSQVFAAGADDFIRKPIVEAEFVARILNRLERVKLMRKLLETDSLTGVTNRQTSTQRLEAYVHSADRQQDSIAIAVLDVANLKDLNSRQGHAIGDAVLRHFGQVLQQSFGHDDIVGRWGGGVFVIGMYGMTREEGVQRLISVLERLNQQPFKIETDDEMGDLFSITFSAGVSQYPEDGTDLPSLYQAADHILQQAKGLRQDVSQSDRLSNALSSILPTETEIEAIRPPAPNSGRATPQIS